MKSIKDLMVEMGFNANAPEQTGAALIKHLIAVTNGGLPPPREIGPPKEVKTYVQLEFDFDQKKQVS